jgi:hypothetical protein
MVMFAILIWLECLLGSFILGLIVLAVIPAFRVTIPNLFVFIIGALPGIIILLYLLQPILIASGVTMNKSAAQLTLMAYTEFFFGALIGGTIAVFFRMLFLNELRKVELRKKAAPRR